MSVSGPTMMNDGLREELVLSDFTKPTCVSCASSFFGIMSGFELGLRTVKAFNEALCLIKSFDLNSVRWK